MSLILIGLILVGTAIYILMSEAQRRAILPFTAHVIEAPPEWSDMNMNDPLIPQNWDEALITRQLTALQERPAALSHYVSSVMDRFILRQNDHTTKVRTQFLRTQLEQLKVAKELHTALDDLTFHSVEREIRQRGLEIQRQDLDSKQHQQQEITDLQHQQEKLKVQLEIARLSRQIREEETPSQPTQAAPSADEVRAQRRSFYEGEIARKQAAKTDAINKGATAEERTRIANMYDDSIQRDMEELSKFL